MVIRWKIVHFVFNNKSNNQLRSLSYSSTICHSSINAPPESFSLFFCSGRLFLFSVLCLLFYFYSVSFIPYAFQQFFLLHSWNAHSISCIEYCIAKALLSCIEVVWCLMMLNLPIQWKYQLLPLVLLWVVRIVWYVRNAGNFSCFNKNIANIEWIETMATRWQ